jgi:hypothetical protein
MPSLHPRLLFFLPPVRNALRAVAKIKALHPLSRPLLSFYCPWSEDLEATTHCPTFAAEARLDDSAPLSRSREACFLLTGTTYLKSR